MKQKKEEKLRLGKITIADFETRLDKDAQEAVRGGSESNPALTTVTPVYC
jgi:hypothetical protein